MRGNLEQCSPDLGDGYGGRFMEPKLKELLKRQNLKASGGVVSISPPRVETVRQPSWIFNNSKADCSASSQDSEEFPTLVVDDQLKKKLKQQYRRAAKGIVLVSSLRADTQTEAEEPPSPRQPHVNSIQDRRELFSSCEKPSNKPMCTESCKDATPPRKLDDRAEDYIACSSGKSDIDHHISFLKQIEMEHAKVLAGMDWIDTFSDSNDNETKTQSKSSALSWHHALQKSVCCPDDSGAEISNLESNHEESGEEAGEEEEAGDEDVVVANRAQEEHESMTAARDPLFDFTNCLTPIVVDSSQAFELVTKGQQEELFASYDCINASYMYWTEGENIRCTLQYPRQKQETIACMAEQTSLGHISCDVVEIERRPAFLIEEHQGNHIPADVHVSFSSQESTNTILCRGKLVREHAQVLVRELKQNLSKMRVKPCSSKTDDLPPHEPPFPPETYGLSAMKREGLQAPYRRSILRDLDRDWLQNLQNRQDPRTKQEGRDAIQRQWRQTSLMIRGSDSCRSIPALPLLEDSRLGTDGQWTLPPSRGSAGRQQTGSLCFRC